MNSTLSNPPVTVHVDEATLRERAYYLWLERGRPSGQDLEIWHAARVLLHDHVNQAPLTITLTLATRQSDPEHHFHAPATVHDKRPDVAASGARQRIRARPQR
jgi:hypothetical protein